MTLIKHELKLNYKAFLIWAISTIFMMIICILIFPVFKEQQEQLSQVFSNMGDFSKAFGLEELNFGTIEGFYGTECGELLALLGGAFAVSIGANILSKEESGHTSEFLLTHPKSRNYIITNKLLSVIFQVLIFNILVVIFMGAAIIFIGEKIALSKFLLYHFTFLIMQIELAMIGFAISSFLRRNSTAIGIGIALMLYFMKIFASISDNLAWLKYVTPHGMINAKSLLEDGTLDWKYFISGIIISIICIVIAYIKYNKKDIY